MGACQNSTTVDTTDTLGKEKKRLDNIQITAVTWERDSHGLFDYEHEHTKKVSFKVSQSSRFARESHNVTMRADDDAKVDDSVDLLQVDLVNSQFKIRISHEKQIPPTAGQAVRANSNEQVPWVVVKSLVSTPSPQPYKLKEGDIIKLGRVKLRVREMKTGQGLDSPPKSLFEQIPFGEQTKKVEGEANNSILGDKGQRKAGDACRICLCDDPEKGNPIVSPCNCSGSMKYVHVKCLQIWLQSRLQVKQTPCALTITWKNFDCELCKHPFPKIMELNGEKYWTVEFPRPPSQSYIVMEDLSKEKDAVKGLHVIDMTVKPSIRIGRGHDADVRITDISCSRTHALITAERGGYYLKDNDSKFGTLVKLRRNLALQPELSNVQIQVGRTVFSIQITKDSKGAMLSCLPNEAAEAGKTAVAERREEIEVNCGDGTDSDDEDEQVQNPRLNNENDEFRAMIASGQSNFPQPNPADSPRDQGIPDDENVD